MTGSDMAGILRQAAQIIATNGLHQRAYIPDPQNLVLKALPHERPMSVIAALRCAETGDPLQSGPVSVSAGRMLAGRLLIEGAPVPFDDASSWVYVEVWGDVPGRTQGEVVEQLLHAAAAAEAVHAALVPMSLTTGDGTGMELASIQADGQPRYVLAGVRDAPAGVFAELGELTAHFGAVLGGAA